MGFRVGYMGLKYRSRLIMTGARATVLRYRVYGLRTMLTLSVIFGRPSSCSLGARAPTPPPRPRGPPPDHTKGGARECSTPDHVCACMAMGCTYVCIFPYVGMYVCAYVHSFVGGEVGRGAGR